MIEEIRDKQEERLQETICTQDEKSAEGPQSDVKDMWLAMERARAEGQCGGFG